MSAARPLGFTGNPLLRDGESRTETTLGEALRHPDARVFLRSGGVWLGRPGSGEGEFDPAFTPAEAKARLGEAPVEILLGTTPDGGAPRLCAETAPLAEDASGEPGFERADLRALGMGERLHPGTEGQLAQGAHLLNWHRQTRFCGRCGAETVSEAAGFRRRCTRCDALVFPRTDPVSIMLVHDRDGRCLLGRQPQFAPGMWSCLAGFIEAGETIEAAVRRETLEEAGIRVGAVRYHASQPWPFPHSLMIGCIAEALDTSIRFDGQELEDCRWFEPDEVRRMIAGTHPEITLPHRFAIARELIESFAAGGFQARKG